MSAQVPPPTDTHTKHYIQLNKVESKATTKDLMKENFKDLIKVESRDIMMDLKMEKLVVTRMDMIRDTTNAKKISKTKYKKLMKNR